MKKNKKLGIWMDHSNAYLLELANESIIENIIASESSKDDEEYSSVKHEKLINSKEQHQLLRYYKKIRDTIRNFQEVVLFGPTDAKNELLNILKADHLFENIKIEIKNSDKMTERQMHAFVLGFFK